MARIEWIKYRLNNWALWVLAGNGGGLGFPSQSAFLNDAPPESGGEAKIPVDEIDASVTNEAVESLKESKPHLYTTLYDYYPFGRGIKETARRAGVAESTIKAHLEQADVLLRAWFTDRAERRDEARAAAKRGFTS